MALAFVFMSCQKENPLDGIWVTAYTQTGNGKPLPSYSRNLMEFGDTSVLVTSIGNFATGDLGNVSSIRLPFEINEKKGVLNFAGDDYNYKLESDSIVLSPLGAASTKIVFRKLGAELSSVSKPAIQGIYSLSAWNFNDTLNFVNDTLIQTYNPNKALQFPSKGWGIHTYKNIHFFNIENDLFGLAPIKSVNGDEIILYNSIHEKYDLRLRALKDMN